MCCVQLKDAISATAWNEVNDMYNALKAAIYGEQGCGSSTSSLRLEQPWLEESRLRVWKKGILRPSVLLLNVHFGFTSQSPRMLGFRSVLWHVGNVTTGWPRLWVLLPQLTLIGCCTLLKSCTILSLLTQFNYQLIFGSSFQLAWAGV